MAAARGERPRGRRSSTRVEERHRRLVDDDGAEVTESQPLGAAHDALLAIGWLGGEATTEREAKVRFPGTTITVGRGA